MKIARIRSAVRGLFLFVLSSADRERVVHSGSAASTVFLPRDVFFDEATRRSLVALRKQQPSDRAKDISDGSSLTKEHFEGSKNTYKDALEGLVSAGDSNRLTLTLVGYKGGPVNDQTNQDRALVIDPLVLSPNSKEDGMRVEQQIARLVGVLDGHGDEGHLVSEYCRQELERRLTENGGALLLQTTDNARNTTAVSEVLVQLVEDIDRSIHRNIGLNAGATVSLVLQLANHVYLINAGDSQSFIGARLSSSSSLFKSERDDLAVVLQSTRLDKPDHPEEYRRILASGGNVSPASEDDDARVYYSHEGSQYGLAMSRSLGDHLATDVIATPTVQVFSLDELYEQAIDEFAAKVPRADRDDRGVTVLDVSDVSFSPLGARDDYFSTCLSSNENRRDSLKPIRKEDVHLFAVSATDGMIDYLAPEYMASAMARSFFTTPDLLAVHPLSAAEHLILHAAELWHDEYNGHYRDDIAIATAKLQR